MTTTSMASPSNKCRFDDDEDPSSTPPLAPLKQRVVNEVGVVVLPMAQTAVPLVAAEKVVLVPQKDNGSDNRGSDGDGEGRRSNGMGSDDGEGSGSDDDEDKALRIPFRTTPLGIMWFKCPVCLGEEYYSEAKLVFQAVDISKQDAGSPDVIKRHCQMLWARPQQ
jgi:hypothetical protein